MSGPDGNYVYTTTEQWFLDKNAAIDVELTNNSLFRSTSWYGGWIWGAPGNGEDVIRLLPKAGLDGEAKQIAERYFQSRQFCGPTGRSTILGRAGAGRPRRSAIHSRPLSGRRGHTP